MYSDIDLDAEDMENELQGAFQELLWFVDRYLSLTGKGDYSNIDVDVIFNRDILINENEAIDNCTKSAGVVSQRTIVSQHPWTKNAQDTIKILQKVKQDDAELAKVNEVIVAKDLPGIAAYDHVNNRLYVCEKLSNSDYCNTELGNGYFAAENAEETIKHELAHKRHWDKINKLAAETGKDTDTAKRDLEAKLREYVVKQVANQHSYVKKVVSLNAWDGFDKHGLLNELIADASLKSEKGLLEDKELFELIKELLK